MSEVRNETICTANATLANNIYNSQKENEDSGIRGKKRANHHQKSILQRVI
jgi:hypothetical protein